MFVANEDEEEEEEEDAKGEEDQGMIFLMPLQQPRQLRSYKRTFLNLCLGRTRERSYMFTVFFNADLHIPFSAKKVNMQLR